MMKSIRILCLILSTFFLSTTAFAYSTIITENSFSTIQQMIAVSKHPHHLLVVLDDDDTLTMEPCYPYSVGTKAASQCQYLGGPAWFSWQAGLSKNDSNRIWKTFPQLLAINDLIFTMSKMPLDDPSIVATLKTVHQIGAHVVIASARGYSMMNPTENQFQRDGILHLIEESAIKTPTDHIGFPGFYMPTPWNNKPVRRIAYEHGILYLAGQNKGIMLQQFLKKTHQTNHINKIIFVDDTYQNVKDVAAAYQLDPKASTQKINVISIHYTRLANHKAAFLKSKTLQGIANTQWKNIKTALRNNLPGSNF